MPAFSPAVGRQQSPLKFPASCQGECLPPLRWASLPGEQLALSSQGILIQRLYFYFFSDGKAGLSQAVSCLLCPCSCSFIAVRCPLDCADAAVSGPCCKLDHWNKSEFLCAYVYVCVCEQLFFFFFGKTWIISVIWFITWPTKRWISTAEEAANSGAEVGTSVWAGGGRRKLLSQLC